MHRLTVEERNACRRPHNHYFCSTFPFSVSLVLSSTCFVSVLISNAHSFPCFLSSSAPSLFSSLPLSLYPSASSLFLSLALLLTSSAVLRPLHEANAHSGLAVAACMRSTGGPIKRRQEQETERESASACPQGPCRYHLCSPFCVCSGACIRSTSGSPSPSPTLPFFYLVCVLSSSRSQNHLRTTPCES